MSRMLEVGGPLLLASLAAISISADEATPTIHIDQIGYPANATKFAIVTATPTVRSFTVHRLPDGEVVLEDELGPPVDAPDSGQLVRLADLSDLEASGTYQLRAGDARSIPFEIIDRPYSDLLRLTARSYYGQRCGTAVDLGPDYPSFTHDECHRSAAHHPSSGRDDERRAPGGWHDAGDYGRYVVNSGISTGTLLWAWELYPDRFRDLDLAIPESDDSTPDLLDEIRWNLDWMLSMQDGDGGVWHKQTADQFAGIILPEDHEATSFVIGTGSEPYKSSCATASFAATMAIAARVYEPFDGPWAEGALDAALSAWNWVTKHPDVVFQNPAGISTGEYGDPDCFDEQLWAAAEIWRTTGDSSFGLWFIEHHDGAVESILPDEPPDWNSVGALAAWSYAMSEDGDAGIVADIIRRSVLAADWIVERSRLHGYRIPLDTDDYEWGSNGVAANYGLQLLVTNHLHPDSAYAQTALEIVHYLLGRNPLSISWVTGAGNRSVMHPHHRPSMADQNGAPWPGLLAGGPNRKRQDPAMESLPPETPPGLMYLDEEASYATNEIAINWNAPLVLVLAGVSE